MDVAVRRARRWLQHLERGVELAAIWKVRPPPCLVQQVCLAGEALLPSNFAISLLTFIGRSLAIQGIGKVILARVMVSVCAGYSFSHAWRAMRGL